MVDVVLLPLFGLGCRGEYYRWTYNKRTHCTQTASRQLVKLRDHGVPTLTSHEEGGHRAGGFDPILFAMTACDALTASHQ